MRPILVLAVALGALVATLSGGLLALKLRDRLHLLLGFSAGAVLAVAFFDLLPEAIRLSDAPVSNLFGATGLGFFLYTVLDRFILLHSHSDAHQSRPLPRERGWAGAASLSAHSFVDGLALGIGFQVSTGVGIVVAAAVLAHDCSDGMNTVNLVLKNGGSRRQAFAWLAADAIAPVFGAATSLVTRLSGHALAYTLALFGGFFLYIGASDLLPESFHAHPKALTTVMTLLGAIMLYAVVRLVA